MDKDAEEEENEKENKPTEEEEMKEGLKKAIKARDQVASAQCDLEEALGKASPKLSGKGEGFPGLVCLPQQSLAGPESSAQWKSTEGFPVEGDAGGGSQSGERSKG